MRWHAASQALLRGQPYRPFDDIVRESAVSADIERECAEEMLRRWGEFEPWPDVPQVLAQLGDRTRFIVTNCSRELAGRAASKVGAFDLVMTAEEAGAYKPDPRPYRAALARLGLAPSEALFVAGSAHDIGGAMRVGMDVYWANRGNVPAPDDAVPLRIEPDMRGLPALLTSREG